MQPANAENLPQLPVDCFKDIIAFLPHKNAARFGLTCKHWKKNFARHLGQLEIASWSLVVGFVNKCCNLRHVTFDSFEAPKLPARIRLVSKRNFDLKSLIISQQLPWQVTKTIFTHLPRSLTQLRLDSYTSDRLVSRREMLVESGQKLSRQTPNLTHLTLFCSDPTSFGTHPSLEDVKNTITDHFPNLTYLNLSGLSESKSLEDIVAATPKRVGVNLVLRDRTLFTKCLERKIFDAHRASELLQFGADPTFEHLPGLRPLLFCQTVAALEFLLEHSQVDFLFTDFWNVPALARLFASQPPEICEYIVSKKLQGSKLFESLSTETIKQCLALALDTFSTSNAAVILKILADPKYQQFYGFDINLQHPRTGKNLIRIAAETRKIGLLQQLLAHKNANFDVQFPDGFVPFELVVFNLDYHTPVPPGMCEQVLERTTWEKIDWRKRQYVAVHDSVLMLNLLQYCCFKRLTGVLRKFLDAFPDEIVREFFEETCILYSQPTLALYWLDPFDSEHAEIIREVITRAKLTKTELLQGACAKYRQLFLQSTHRIVSVVKLGIPMPADAFASFLHRSPYASDVLRVVAVVDWLDWDLETVRSEHLGCNLIHRRYFQALDSFISALRVSRNAPFIKAFLEIENEDSTTSQALRLLKSLSGPHAPPVELIDSVHDLCAIATAPHQATT